MFTEIGGNSHAKRKVRVASTCGGADFTCLKSAHPGPERIVIDRTWPHRHPGPESVEVTGSFKKRLFGTDGNLKLAASHIEVSAEQVLDTVIQPCSLTRDRTFKSRSIAKPGAEQLHDSDD